MDCTTNNCDLLDKIVAIASQTVVETVETLLKTIRGKNITLLIYDKMYCIVKDNLFLVYIVKTIIVTCWTGKLQQQC
jgi:enamine deaminase RidA (YjgF/YER057c/UK114 family)